MEILAAIVSMTPKTADSGEYLEVVISWDFQIKRAFIRPPLMKFFQEQFAISDVVTLQGKNDEAGFVVSGFKTTKKDLFKPAPVTGGDVERVYTNAMGRGCVLSWWREGGHTLCREMPAEACIERGAVKVAGGSVWPNYIPKIDFVMDELGAAVVNAQIKAIVGSDKVSDLLKAGGWQKKYQAWLDGAVETALAAREARAA